MIDQPASDQQPDPARMLDLAEDFAQLGRVLNGTGNNPAALQRLADLAAMHVPGCDWASITLLKGDNARTLTRSDTRITRADELQYELGEGPCLQAADDRRDYLLFNAHTEQRWPRYAAALLEHTPVRSVLAFDLPAFDRAALNLYAAQPGAFTDDSITLGTLFAAHASTTVALHETSEHAANLTVALTSNRQIGIAIGILMAHHKVTQDKAFTMLREASQHLHIKLRDIALEVSDTGTLPDHSESHQRPA